MTTLHRAAGERFTVELTLNGQRRCGEAEPRMVVVKVNGNDFQTVGKVPGAEAVGPDKCEKF